MKKTFVMCLIFLAAMVSAGENDPWVDFEKCAICSNATAEEGLMENMNWEHHLFATGLMTTTTVNADFQDHFARAKAKMQKVLGEVMAGEEKYLCGYCTSLTSLLKEGAKLENFVTHGSDVLMLSSTDETQIAKIHKHGKQVLEFLNPSHEGHEH